MDQRRCLEQLTFERATHSYLDGQAGGTQQHRATQELGHVTVIKHLNTKRTSYQLLYSLCAQSTWAYLYMEPGGSLLEDERKSSIDFQNTRHEIHEVLLLTARQDDVPKETGSN